MSDEKDVGASGAPLPGDDPGAQAGSTESSTSSSGSPNEQPALASAAPAEPGPNEPAPQEPPAAQAGASATVGGATAAPAEPAGLAAKAEPKPLAVGGLRFLPGPQAPQPPAPLWQWLGIGLGGTLLVMALARVAGTSLQEPPRPLSPSVVTPEEARPKPLPSPPSLLTVTARPIGDLPPTEALDSMRGDAGRRSAFARRYDKKHPPPKYAYPTEQMAIDATRAALDAKDPSKAIAILDQYDKDFGGDVSSTDARALRIEALAMSHRSDEAMRLADQFLEDYPHSPRADRVRALKQAIASQ